jgi:hypothetical protein
MAELIRYTSDGFLYGAVRSDPKIHSTRGFNPEGTQAAQGYSSPVQPTGSLVHKLARKLLTIFGTDGRSEITFKAAYPYSTIGQLFFKKASGGNYICSGAMISSGALMTSAHCVWDRSTSKWQTSWQFAARQYLSGGVRVRVSTNGPISSALHAPIGEILDSNDSFSCACSVKT